MQMKAGYVWILLLLATAASASPPPLTPPPPSALVKDDERNADVLPLSVVRESNEKDRLALTPEPVVLTQQEELVEKKRLTANALTLQERQAEALIEQKSNIYTMKVQYKEALAEKQKVW